MKTPSDRPLVGISISESPDLPERGFGMEHLSELMISIARSVLRLKGNVGLVYGGDLRPDGFTRQLFDLALSERTPPAQKEQEPPRRIYNYLAWPHYLALTKRDEAKLINVCHFMRVRPKDAGFAEIPDDRDKRQQVRPPATLVGSRCLTRMRELSTWGGHLDFDDTPAPPLRARIMLGGKQSGYSSFMPGLLEEFLISRQPPTGKEPLPVFIVGAFGGAAGQLAEALVDEAKTRPLFLDYQLNNEAAAATHTLKQLVAEYAQEPSLPQPEARYEALRSAVRTLRDAILGGDPEAPGNGLTPEENQRLLQSRDEVEIRQLVIKGLAKLCE